MTAKEYREVITKNLENIEDELGLETLYKYSEILAKWDEVTRGNLYRALIISEIFDERAEDERVAECHTFIETYLR